MPFILFFFPELANAGRPLFPGNDVDDQLKRIFRYPFHANAVPTDDIQFGMWVSGLFRQNYSYLNYLWTASLKSNVKSLSLTALYIVGNTNWRTVANNDKTPRLQGSFFDVISFVKLPVHWAFTELFLFFTNSFSSFSHIPCILPPPHWLMWSLN